MSESKLFTLYHNHSEALEQSLAINADQLESYAKSLAEAFAAGQRLIIVSSGALAGVATTLTNAFLYRLEVERPSLPVVAVHHNYSLATTLCADNAFGQYLSCQLQAQASAGDHVLILADGADAVTLTALKTATELGCSSVVVSCDDESNWKKEGPDMVFPVAASSVARGMEAMLFLSLALCELVEAELFGF